MARMPKIEVELELMERNTMKLYEYAVILHPTDKEREDGKTAEIVVPVTAIVAKDENEVRLIAARNIAGPALSATDRVEVAVRPFC